MLVPETDDESNTTVQRETTDLIMITLRESRQTNEKEDESKRVNL